MENTKKVENQPEYDLPIVWQAPEYEYDTKGVSWYWLTFIIAILVFAFALWHKNFLFAALTAMAELFILYFAGQEPKIWTFRITEDGIGIGDNKFYNYKHLGFFDLHPYSADFVELVFKTNEKIVPIQKILVHDEDKEIIETELSKHLKKADIPLTMIDTLERLIRF